MVCAGVRNIAAKLTLEVQYFYKPLCHIVVSVKPVQFHSNRRLQ